MKIYDQQICFQAFQLTLSFVNLEIRYTISTQSVLTFILIYNFPVLKHNFHNQTFFILLRTLSTCLILSLIMIEVLFESASYLLTIYNAIYTFLSFSSFSL